ncbi:MAG: sodium:calcium antiporter, partial [Candidatus Bathyarchaeia archaeon]
EPFITSLRAVAVLIGLSQFLFIQWVAPFLSEFPESTSAFIWAGRIRFAPMAMANLISSKLNQWTLLIATIPIVYSLSLGAPGVIPLTGLQFEEVLLTAAQSSYGVTCLLDLRFRLRDAVVLFVLFMAQFLVPAIRLEVAIAYFAATAIELAIMKDRMLLFRELRDLRKHRASGTTPTTAGS